ncbi:MAG: phenylalanine 4-monooxygenase [Phycisphaeraceae bacterium]|nr:MAG: phenylalanine 4-monooxygenase [Phycisphaeraceae bacterium]
MRDDIAYNNIIDGNDFARAQAAADAAADLPADQIDTEGFYVPQLYDRYSDENHEVWGEMYEKRWAMLEEQASNTFIAGLKAIRVQPDRVPLLFGEVPHPTKPEQTVKGINEYLRPLTGWQSRGVPGYLPAKAFFSCLSRREFPTTIVVRPKEQMDYLPEPDIFHDVFGHVPLHADDVFADFLQTYGKAALHAGDQHTEALSRLFWFTVEFGLIKEDGRLKIYGSGLISSHGEAKHALHAPEAAKGVELVPSDVSGKIERRPFDMDRVCATGFEIDHYQPVLYVLESFEQLRDAMSRYADRVLEEAGQTA